MPDPTHVALVRRWAELFDSHGVLAALEDIVTSDVVLENPGESGDMEALRARVRELLTCCPDAEMAITDLISDGDNLVIESEFSGTHLGTYRGIEATGRSLTFNVLIVARLRGQRIARLRMYPETLSMLMQMGALPDLPPDT